MAEMYYSDLVLNSHLDKALAKGHVTVVTTSPVAAAKLRFALYRRRNGRKLTLVINGNKVIISKMEENNGKIAR
jgi:hypothetical protein